MLDPLDASSTGTRLKDLVSIEGVRDNQLVGYGLVVGLNGTGDKRQTVFSSQSLTNLLARMGVQVSPTAILVRNMAAVLVTANLPPFAQPGTRIDILVAAIGDSTNLQGGVLILTAAQSPDGQVYAAAQGSVITGGFVAGKGGGSSQTVNHPTAGRVPNGAIVEKLAPSIAPEGHLKLQLLRADFTTAGRVSNAINVKFGKDGKLPAHADNSALVSVDLPSAYKTKVVEFLGELEDLVVETDRPARIVVNERTGTIVMGKGRANRAGGHIAWIVDCRNPNQPERIATHAAVPRANHRHSAGQRRGQGRESPQRRAEAGSQRRRIGAGVDGHRIHAARRDCDPAKSKSRRRSGGGIGGHLISCQ